METPSPDYFKEHPYSGTQYFLKSKYPEFYEYLQSTYPGLKPSEQMYKYYYGDSQPCPICGQSTKYINFNKGYAKFCSVKCSRNSEQTKQKAKQTCLEKYGVENPQQNKQIRLKTRQTNLERYGTDTPLQNDQILNKVRQTNLEKYGVEYVGQIEEVKEKIKQTNLERYGVEYVGQIEEVKEKIKQTNLERYGVEHPMQCEEIRLKSKQTCLEKYGVENPMQCAHIQQRLIKKLNTLYGGIGLSSQHIQQKAKQTCLEKYGVENPMQCREIKNKSIKTFKDNFQKSNKFLQGYTEDGNWICRCPHPECNKCQEKYFITPSGIRHDRLRAGAEICTNLFPVGSHETSFSNISQFVFKELDKQFVGYTTHYATKDFEYRVGQYSLDYFVEELNLVIEFNGDYWHANPKFYEPDWIHPIIKKTAKEMWEKDTKRQKYLESLGYKVVIIWEDEIMS